MKDKMSEQFSFSVTKSKYTIEKHDKIELVSCPLKGLKCKEFLSVINKSYTESEQYLREKDFHRSIETLKSAFNKTIELMEHPCNKCAQHFRSIIIESLENIRGELGKMSKGIFGNKRYQSSYIKANNTLMEFENLEAFNTSQPNESRKRFLGNHLN